LYECNANDFGRSIDHPLLILEFAMTSILTKVTLAAALIVGGLVGTQSIASAHGGHGGHGGHGFGHGHHHPVFHDTSHFDYHPGHFQSHGNHFHYVPGHFDFHQTGHWHW
jgi:hypothetical protein